MYKDDPVEELEDMVDELMERVAALEEALLDLLSEDEDEVPFESEDC